MTNVKISGLPAATVLTGTELVPVVQSGVTVQTTSSAFTSTVLMTGKTFVTPTLTSPTINGGVLSGTLSGTVTASGAWTFTNASPIALSATTPRVDWYATGDGADAKRWAALANGGVFYLQTRTDADVFGASALTIGRSGTAVGAVAWTGTSYTFNGVAVPTISSTDTLTNKTLTSPTINGASLSGTLSGTPTFSSTVTSSASQGFFASFSSGSSGGAYKIAKPASGTTIAGDVVMDVNANSLRIYENGGTFRGLIIDLTTLGTQSIIATTDTTQTFTNKTLTTPTINSASLSGTLSGTPTFTGNPTFTGGNLILNAANYGIEIGSSASSNTPYIDFHTTNSVNDYDVRVIASGGTTLGTGLLNIIGGSFQFNSVEVPTISSASTFTNKTLTSPVINGGTSSSAIQTSSETIGTLTAANSANKRVACTSGVTLPSSGMTVGDTILIDPQGTARVITRPAAHTMWVKDVDSATTTTYARNPCVAIFTAASTWTVSGVP